MNGSITPIQQDWCDWANALTFSEYLENHGYKVMLPRGNYKESTRDPELEKKWGQVTTAVKTYSWRAIYAKNDGEFNFHLQQMLQAANSYGYDLCVAWCEEEAARCWAEQLAAAGK